MKKIKLKTLIRLKSGFFLLKPKSVKIKRIPWAKPFLYKILNEKNDRGERMCFCYNNQFHKTTNNSGWNTVDFSFYRLTEQEAKDFLLLDAL